MVSANDTMAGGIIASLADNGLDGKVPVTGQDASVEGLQRILAGTQCMTVYKNTALEAKAASDLAIALINGDDAGAEALATGSVKDTETGKDVPSALATPQAIFQDSVKTSIADGFQKASDVCTGDFAALCTKYGVEVGRRHESATRPRFGGGWAAPSGRQRVHRQGPEEETTRVHDDTGGDPPGRPRRDRCCACAASTRASAPCTSCAASTSTSPPAG